MRTKQVSKKRGQASNAPERRSVRVACVESAALAEKSTRPAPKIRKSPPSSTTTKKQQKKPKTRTKKLDTLTELKRQNDELKKSLARADLVKLKKERNGLKEKKKQRPQGSYFLLDIGV